MLGAGGGRLVHWRMFSSVPGLSSLDAGSTLRPHYDKPNCLDIITCPMGGKITPVENHQLNQHWVLFPFWASGVEQ